MAFVAGCGCQYYLWNPPSNDWGNEKTTSTLLLVAASVLILVVALIARRPLLRLFRLALRIGRAGLAGLVVGAVLLPVAQLCLVIQPWWHHAVNLARQRAEMIDGLEAIRGQLARADAIVVYGVPSSSPEELGRFFRNLSDATGKPVYRLGRAGADRWIITRYKGVPEAVTEFPTTGSLLRFVPDLSVQFAVNRLQDDRAGRDYYSIALTPLERQPDELGKPPYRVDDPPVPVWRNCGFVKPGGTTPDGPMPFGRLVGWEECALLLDTGGLEDRLLGAEPPSARSSSP